jgi:hypothetical protein
MIDLQYEYDRYRKEKFYLEATANEKLHDGEPVRVIDVFAGTET